MYFYIHTYIHTYMSGNQKNADRAYWILQHEQQREALHRERGYGCLGILFSQEGCIFGVKSYHESALNG